MLRQSCIVFISIVKIILRSMMVTPNNASQVVIRLRISHPNHIFSVTFTSRHLPKTLISNVKVKVKQSRYRPGVAQRVPGS